MQIIRVKVWTSINNADLAHVMAKTAVNAFQSLKMFVLHGVIGLKRLPLRTHSGIVAPICGLGLLPLRLELMCRCASFIVKCLKSSNGVVRSIATHGMYVQRMRSPVGRNAQHSASVFEVPLFHLAGINKKSAWSLLHRDWFSNLSLYSISQIIELLYVKHRCADLPLFSESEIDCFIEHLCTA